MRPESAGWEVIGFPDADVAPMPATVAAPMRIVPAIPAERAFAAHRNVPARHPGGAAPPPDYRPQIDGGGSTRRQLAQGTENLRADLVAAAADGRAKVHKEFLRIAPEGFGQGIQPRFHHSCRSAPPACMQESHCPPARIHNEHRHAVGQGDGQEHPGNTGRMAITLAGQAHPTRGPTMYVDRPAMDLTTPHDRAPARGQGPVHVVGLLRRRQAPGRCRRRGDGARPSGRPGAQPRKPGLPRGYGARPQ